MLIDGKSLHDKSWTWSSEADRSNFVGVMKHGNYLMIIPFRDEGPQSSSDSDGGRYSMYRWKLYLKGCLKTVYSGILQLTLVLRFVTWILQLQLQRRQLHHGPEIESETKGFHVLSMKKLLMP
jgi:hypothetical protein